MNEIRFIDLFSGIGGFRLGLKRANKTSLRRETPTGSNIRSQGDCAYNPSGKTWEYPKFLEDSRYRCVWSNDFNKYANQVYTNQFGEENHYSADIRGVNPEEIPDFDLLCAGFPCQAFSVAGKRKGFQDTRGTLFFEICRIAEAKRPPLLLLENVKGLLNHDRGRTFTVILQTLDELGYWVEWQVLNSKHFGVPQNRQRVFIIGHLRGTGGREIFPIRQNDVHCAEGVGEEQGGQIGASLTGQSASGNNARGNYVAHCIDSNYYKGTSVLNSIRKRQRQLVVGNDALKELDQVLSGFKIRRLTPVECERLQGFPDGWTEGISDTQRYKCLGNTVTVNVIEFLGRLIKSSWFTSKGEE